MPTEADPSATRAAAAAAALEAADIASCGWLATRLTLSNRLSRCLPPLLGPGPRGPGPAGERRGRGGPPLEWDL